MKRLCFVMPDLKTGGVQKAFLNLLTQIDYTKFIVDVCVFSNEKCISIDNPNLNFISLPNKFRYFITSLKDSKRYGFAFFIKKLFLSSFARIFGNGVCKFLIGKTTLPTTYDVCISYFHDTEPRGMYAGFTYFALNSVKSNRVLSFIHADIEQTPVLKGSFKKELDKVDSICCVSDEIREKVRKHLKKDNVCTIKNVNNVDDIIGLSKESIDLNFPKDGKINFVSVGRISIEKGFFRMLDIFDTLVKQNITNFRWVIVGGGPLLEGLKSKIREFGLESFVYAVGNKSNPYPYISMSDILILCSFHEACPMVVDEAKILGKIIFAAKYSSSNTQLSFCDMVVDNSFNGLCNGIKLLLNNYSHSEYKNIMSYSQITKKYLDEPLESFYKAIES